MVRFFFALLCALVALAAPARAQSRLFSSNDPIQFTLDAPLTDIARTARNNTDPRPAAIVLDGGQRIDIQVRPRGLTRRTGSACAFPPLRLELADGVARDTIFQGQDKLKLVTYCRQSANNDQYVQLEYLAYRLYNEVTPLSFRVRGGAVTYHDSNGRRGDLTRFGFLIENIDDVAKRNNRAELEAQTGQITFAQLDPHTTVRYALFQYMIGNLDWDYNHGPAGDTCCHNSRFIATQGATANIIPVPYDFDYAGLVDAPYAAPPAGFETLSSVRVRRYRGICAHNGELPAAIQEFQAHRAAFNALIASQPGLSDGSRTKATRYLDAFYEIIGDPRRVQSELIGRCRG